MSAKKLRTERATSDMNTEKIYVTRSKENEAKGLFRKGVECELEHNTDQATQFYKRAFKLDPDVEKKIADEDAITKSAETLNKPSDKRKYKYVFKENLFLRFQRILGPQICFPEHEQRTTHFSVLPPELVLYLFRWVVSSELDLRTLEQCAAVSRGWYLCARDPELWRRACSKFWPSSSIDLVPFNGSWRRMFIERPNVLTIGCYICRISYVREGEESFRDVSVGPSFNVVYFRYLRFFADGRALMLLSYHPPAFVLPDLRSIETAPSNACPGHYRLSGNKLYVTLVDGEQKDQIKLQSAPRKTTFNMIFEITNLKSKHNRKLLCLDYEIVYKNQKNEEMVTKYLLSNNSFPPFIFSRVICYSIKSNRVL